MNKYEIETLQRRLAQKERKQREFFEKRAREEVEEQKKKDFKPFTSTIRGVAVKFWVISTPRRVRVKVVGYCSACETCGTCRDYDRQ